MILIKAILTFAWILIGFFFCVTEKTVATHPVLLPGKSPGRRSLEGCSPWGRWGSDTTERLPFHFSLSCIGEENGNPLQCSCLENPTDGGAWWAAVYGVTQSRTRLKWLSIEYCSFSCLSVRTGFIPHLWLNIQLQILMSVFTAAFSLKLVKLLELLNTLILQI